MSLFFLSLAFIVHLSRFIGLCKFVIFGEQRTKKPKFAEATQSLWSRSTTLEAYAKVLRERLAREEDLQFARNGRIRFYMTDCKSALFSCSQNNVRDLSVLTLLETNSREPFYLKREVDLEVDVPIGYGIIALITGTSVTFVLTAWMCECAARVLSP